MEHSQKYWWLNEESSQVLNRGYLLQGETVQDAIVRVTEAAAKRLYRPEWAEKFRELIERGWMSLSSPIWANMGTSRGLPISCFNVHIPDSMAGITSKLGEVIMQTKLGGGTSGYFGELRGRGRAITDNGKSSGAVSFMKLFDAVMDTVSQGACYQKGTKVLTDKGFKDFREVQPGIDLIAQVDESNNITFTSTYELTKKHFKGNLIKIRGKKRDDLISVGVTPNHRMVIEKMKGSSRNKTKRWSNKTEIVLAKDLKLHRDNRLFMSGKTSISSSSLSDEERLKIAFQADGRKEYKSSTMQFRFKKVRKIERLKSICKRLNLVFEEKFISEDNSITFYIYNVNHLKEETLSWIDITKISYDWCIQFLDELCHWDSHIRSNTDSFNYSSTIKENVIKVQEITVLSGKRNRVFETTNREGNRKDLYSINISDKPQIQGDSCEIYEEFYDDYVFCAIVPNGRLVVSFEDRTLICGNTRRGAFAAYLDIDHPDVKEMLEIKDIGNPIQNIFFSVCIPDYWMQEMIDGDEDKRELWAKVLESRQTKGLPYLFFTDNVNKHKPQVYKELNMKINASNLCSEIALPSNEDESFVCCLSSMNLELYDEWKDTDAVKYATYFLDAVMSEFITKTKEDPYLRPAHNFAKNHRAIGLGVMGWHSYLQKNMISFESLEAKMLTNKIFNQLEKETLEASVQLGQNYGYAPIFDSFMDSKGNYSTKDTLRRNTTLLAIAPTTSSSAILGQTSPGIEPFSSNYFKAGLAKGNFMRKNKYLEALLESKNLNNEDIWRSIMLAQGSVQHLDELSQEEKDVFKTFKEISQYEIILQASIRQKYIDQSQSLNINIPSQLPIKKVNRLIIEAWQLGVKTLYYQRSQSVSKEMLTNIPKCVSCES